MPFSFIYLAYLWFWSIAPETVILNKSCLTLSWRDFYGMLMLIYSSDCLLMELGAVTSQPVPSVQVFPASGMWSKTHILEHILHNGFLWDWSCKHTSNINSAQSVPVMVLRVLESATWIFQVDHWEQSSWPCWYKLSQEQRVVCVSSGFISSVAVSTCLIVFFIHIRCTSKAFYFSEILWVWKTHGLK